MNDRGNAGEDAALAYLQQRGLRLVTRNYRCRMGEIDLILRDRDTLVFAEVRQRRSSSFGGAAASITTSKQRRIIAAAGHYLAALGREVPCRFDVVLLEGQPPQIEWLTSAFTA